MACFVAAPAEASSTSLKVSEEAGLVVVSGVKLRDLEARQNSLALQKVAQAVYVRYQDRADFLLLIANRRTVPAQTRVAGFHYRVSNAVGGIGISKFNAGANFGGTRRLQGILYFPRWYPFWRVPLLHELAHQWVNDVLPESGEAGHFGFCSSGGQVGGFERSSLRPLGAGLYQAFNLAGQPFGTASNGRNVPYSPLELYLMGLIPASEVPPTECARKPVWHDQTQGVFRAIGFERITVQDLISRFGPRTPGPEQSQKVFRLFVVLVSEQPPSRAEVQGATHSVGRLSQLGDDGDLGYSFHEATRGLARLQLIVPSTIRR